MITFVEGVKDKEEEGGTLGEEETSQPELVIAVDEGELLVL